MIAKTTPSSPIHLLDHIIIPIHIRESHWFPAHINLRTHVVSLLDSSQDYSAAAYPLQRMLIWKFIRMVWAKHAATAPAPLWIIPPAGLIDLHPRLINLPSSVIKLLGQGTTQEKIDIMNISTHELKANWTQRGISPALLGWARGCQLDAVNDYSGIASRHKHKKTQTHPGKNVAVWAACMQYRVGGF